jgi:hypothetical protein
MKNFLNKLAALADEADSAGMREVADTLDSMLQVVALFDPAGDALDASHFDAQETQKLSDALDENAVQEQIGPEAQKAAQLKVKHAEVAAMLRDIAQQFSAAGKIPPFMLPSGEVTGSGLKAALATLGITNYRSWGDINTQLAAFRSKTFPKDMNQFQANPAGPMRGITQDKVVGQDPFNRPLR